MGFFDGPIRAIVSVSNKIDEFFERITNPRIGDDQTTEVLAEAIQENEPSTEVSAAIVDLVEEFVVQDLQEAGTLKPENVEEIADETEGGATAVLASLGLASTSVEALTLGQVDKQTEWITQALVGLGVDDVTGLELEARIENGIMPALEAKHSKDHTPEFVALQDAHEYALRNKETDEGYLRASGATQDVIDRVGSNVPENRDNLLEEWGMRPDQLPILEEVGLEAMEFEELIETPAELGLIVDEEVLDETLDLAGYPEDLKDFLRQVPDEIPRSNRAWEERTAVEALVDELEPIVKDKEMRPETAAALLPGEADIARDALEDRFRNLQKVPAGAPTRAQLESSFTRGYTDREALQDRLGRLEYDVGDYPGVFKASIVDELDGDLQESLALGLIDENQFSNLCQFVGLDQSATDALMRGESLTDISERRLKKEQSLADAPVTAIQGIGEARSTSLQTLGIETVGDLAQAGVDEVADTAQVEPGVAEEWINVATQAVNQGGP